MSAGSAQGSQPRGLAAVWASRGPWAILLLPLSGLYAALAWLDRWSFQSGLRKVYRSRLPVVIVGNLSVGGTGKSPLTAWLCKQLAAAGVRPGIVSRGYGGQVRNQAHRVRLTDSPALVGDEPLMLAQQTQMPVVVCGKRALAVALLEQSGEVDVIVSDDGLQHHAMARDVEIVVIDQARGFGNGFYLPAGPMRESSHRLNSVDHVVYQRQPATDEKPAELSFLLDVTEAIGLTSGEMTPLADYQGQHVHAVAAIGHPARFFDVLRSYGLKVIEHPLPDHHPLKPSDVCFDNAYPVLVTSKDAVKLDASNQQLQHVQVVPAILQPSTRLQHITADLLKGFGNKREHEREQEND